MYIGKSKYIITCGISKIYRTTSVQNSTINQVNPAIIGALIFLSYMLFK
jgi:hypothetical protein